MGDYYNNAIKLALTFEDFFIKGIGIDALVKGADTLCRITRQDPVTPFSYSDHLCCDKL